MKTNPAKIRMKLDARIAIAALFAMVGSAVAQQTGDVAASTAAGEIAEAVLGESSERGRSILFVPGSVAAISDSVTATVTLSAIDAATRQISFIREDGQADEMIAGPGVANFAQLAVGDKVVVVYTEAFAVYLSPAEVSDSIMAAGIVRAEDGAAPGGALLGQGQVKAGDMVAVAISKALAISVEKP